MPGTDDCVWRIPPSWDVNKSIRNRHQSCCRKYCLPASSVVLRVCEFSDLIDVACQRMRVKHLISCDCAVRPNANFGTVTALVGASLCAQRLGDDRHKQYKEKTNDDSCCDVTEPLAPG